MNKLTEWRDRPPHFDALEAHTRALMQCFPRQAVLIAHSAAIAAVGEERRGSDLNAAVLDHFLATANEVRTAQAPVQRAQD